MVQVPGRLVYTDSDQNVQVIGSFQPQDVTSGNISTFTLDSEAENYKRAIIEGGPTLEENMPVQQSEFGTSEPEIRVQIDSNRDGTWEDRMRVYPEQSGSTNDRGQYKNKNLWGFKKYYGEADVSTGTISTDLTGALDALLPSGYTARYPGDITAPNVNNYSYSGSRQQGFKELQRHYEHFIIFTNETDGNGDYYVDLQPFGYGDVQYSLVRGQDSLVYDYWKKNDLSNVVSKVRVVGKDSNDAIVDVTRTASDIGETADRERFRRVHVDYTINTTEAEDIGDNILQPNGVEQGAIETSLDPTSNLNDSVGIIDESRSIDDVFTVVKQKDFLHQGISYYSFEYEQESTQRQRDKWREHDNERAKVYPGDDTDVGSQNVDADTEDVEDSYDEHNDNPGAHDVGGNTYNEETFDDGGSMDRKATDSESFSSQSFSDGGTLSLSDTTPSFDPAANKQWLFNLNATSSDQNAEIEIVAEVAGFEVYRDVHLVSSSGEIFATEPVFADVSISTVGITVTFKNISGSSITLDGTTSFDVYGEDSHFHDMEVNQPSQPDGAEPRSDGSTNDTNPFDASAGDTTSLNATGNTDAKNVNITNEDKTDR